MLLEANALDFDKLGTEAAGAFFEESVPLEDAVIKIAKDRELNPEEVKRLVEKANTYASVKLIKAASDKTVEFDLAEYAKVLASTHPEGGDAVRVKTAMHTQTAMPQEMPCTIKEMALSQAREHSFFKIAETTPEEPNRKPLASVFKYQREISRLGQEKTAAELGFKKAADQLISDFSSLYGPDFNKFASEAYTLYGEPGKCILDVLAASVKEKPEFNKVAYVVDDVSNKELQLFKTAYEALITIDDTRNALTAAKENLDAAWTDAKRVPAGDA